MARHQGFPLGEQWTWSRVSSESDGLQQYHHLIDGRLDLIPCNFEDGPAVGNIDNITCTVLAVPVIIRQSKGYDLGVSEKEVHRRGRVESPFRYLSSLFTFPQLSSSGHLTRVVKNTVAGSMSRCALALKKNSRAVAWWKALVGGVCFPYSSLF